MADKTYVDIGRVAPVVKGAWSSSTAYNKLNIVSNSGGSYIAKKDVPAGTALSNTEYWMELVTGSGSSDFPVLTFESSQIVSSNPLVIQCTDAQASLIDDSSYLIYDLRLSFTNQRGPVTKNVVTTSVATSVIFQALYHTSTTSIGSFVGSYNSTTKQITMYFNVVDSSEINTHLDNLVTAWSATPTDAHYPSEKLVYDTIGEKGQKVTSWSTPPSDSNYPSEKLVSETLADVGQKVTSWSATTLDSNYPSEKLVYDTISPLQTDYVIASYETNNMSWRKWSSGMSEFWGRKTLNNEPCFTQPWTDVPMYMTASISSGLTFPTGLFLTGSALKMQISFASSADPSTPAFIWNDGSQGTTEPCQIKLMRPNPAYITGRIHYYFQGRWKDST